MRRRIAIIGCAGTGKTTLSKKLELLGIPAIHLDSLYWKPGWVKTDKSVWEEKVQSLSEEVSWILDGGFGSTLDIRIRKADTVVYLDMPTSLCLYRVLKRWMKNRGRTRPDMAEGWTEKIDLSLLSWLLTFRLRKRPGILQKLCNLPISTETIILRIWREVDDFVSAIEEEVSSSGKGTTGFV